MTVYDFIVQSAHGEAIALDRYRGQVLLIVNTASRCGFTPQYEGLEALQRRFGERGFSVLAFPCNQFGQQEPEGDDTIQSFCQLNYGVSFPVMAKIEVNGRNADPLFDFLKQARRGVLSDAIKWNFTKFLIDREGQVADRFAPTTKPERLAAQIEALLGEGDAT